MRPAAGVVGPGIGSAQIAACAPQTVPLAPTPLCYPLVLGKFSQVEFGQLTISSCGMPSARFSTVLSS